MLDLTKAFDRISHYGLFNKLMDRNVPLCFLMIIIYGYLNLKANVKWGNAVSNYFDVPTGTKQGGILSPDFFGIYINDLVGLLKASGVGCHVLKIFVAAILYA